MNHRIRPGFIALDALSLFLYIIYQCPGSSSRQPSHPLPPIVLLVSVINTGVKRSRIIDEECERVGERPDDRHCPINISNSSFIHCRRAVDDDDAVFETTSQPSRPLLLHYYPPLTPFLLNVSALRRLLANGPAPGISFPFKFPPVNPPRRRRRRFYCIVTSLRNKIK